MTQKNTKKNCPQLWYIDEFSHGSVNHGVEHEVGLKKEKRKEKNANAI